MRGLEKVCPMPAREYIITISTDAVIYANTGVTADDDADALRQAKKWASSRQRWEDGWLIVKLDERGVATLKPGEF
jgi:hypothetical protein